jgi:hypothetical protein
MKLSSRRPQLPTPNEDDIDLFHFIRPYQPIGSGVRVVEAPSANESIDKIAAYREEIIASEREAAADRAEAKAKTFRMHVYDLGEWKDYKLDALSLAGLRAAITEGQPATPLQEARDRGERH